MKSEGLRTIRVGDIDVAYRLEGPERAPLVVLVHGLMSDQRSWDGVVARLKSHWRVLRYDLRGHGGTTAPPPPYAMAQLANDAIGLFDALGVDRGHYIGLSLGGMLGQYLGAHHAGRFSSLTLANTTCEQVAAGAWQQRIETAASRGLQPLIAGTLQRWLTPDAARDQPDLVARAQTIAGATSVNGFIGCARIVRDLSQRGLLARIALPTLVIAGAFDQATSVDEARVIAESIPGSRLHLVEAAHQSAMECPEAFASAWLAFQGDVRVQEEAA